MTTWVSQIALAKDLGLTDRRIRQLAELRILPTARDEGHDLELSRHRYRLYSNGSELDWEKCFNEAEELARVAGELNDKAYAEGAVVADVTIASRAIQASTSMMAFLTAAKSKTDSERKLFWGIWDREEHQALGALFVRAMELEGATHLRTDDGELIEVVPPTRSAKRRSPVKARKKAGRAKAPAGRK